MRSEPDKAPITDKKNDSFTAGHIISVNIWDMTAMAVSIPLTATAEAVMLPVAAYSADTVGAQAVITPDTTERNCCATSSMATRCVRIIPALTAPEHIRHIPPSSDMGYAPAATADIISDAARGRKLTESPDAADAAADSSLLRKYPMSKVSAEAVSEILFGRTSAASEGNEDKKSSASEFSYGASVDISNSYSEAAAG
jgi:hypothetical protein